MKIFCKHQISPPLLNIYRKRTFPNWHPLICLIVPMNRLYRWYRKLTNFQHNCIQTIKNEATSLQLFKNITFYSLYLIHDYYFRREKTKAYLRIRETAIHYFIKKGNTVNLLQQGMRFYILRLWFGVSLHILIYTIKMNKIELCKKCKNRQMDLQQGITCGLTNKKPTFIEKCENFEKDETLKQFQGHALRPNNMRAKFVLFSIGIVLILDVISSISSGM